MESHIIISKTCMNDSRYDMFSAVLAGSMLAGKPFPKAVKRAMDVIERLIFLEQDELEKNKGIRIERFLDLLKE